MLSRSVVPLDIIPHALTVVKTDKVAQDCFKNYSSRRDEINPFADGQEIYMQIFGCPIGLYKMGY